MVVRTNYMRLLRTVLRSGRVEERKKAASPEIDSSEAVETNCLISDVWIRSFFAQRDRQTCRVAVRIRRVGREAADLPLRPHVDRVELLIPQQVRHTVAREIEVQHALVAQ